jgi:cytochrome b
MKAGSDKILVWDIPTRVFHWTLVLCFAAAWLTAESERWRLVHVTAGYTMVGLVGFRLVWGFIGTRYARFRSFVTGPVDVIAYVKSTLTKNPKHYVGHNPLGSIAVLLLLFLIMGLGLTGYVLYNDLTWFKAEDVHELLANTMLLLVIIHVCGVILSSWLHRENLVRAMVTGCKLSDKREGIQSHWMVLGIFIISSCLLFWIYQFVFIR